MEVERRHHSGLDRDKLLAALAELPRDRRRVLDVVPRVLTNYGEGHVTVSFRHPDGSLSLASTNDPRLEPGISLPSDGIVGLAARERRAVYLEDAPAHPLYRDLYGPSYPVEMTLPLFEREHVTAILNIERERPYSDAERRTLEVFAGGISHHLTQASHSLEARLSAALSMRAVETPGLAEAAEVALELVAPAVGAEAAVLLCESSAKMLPVAQLGLGAVGEMLASGTPYPDGFAWQTCLTGEVSYARSYGSDPRAVDRLRSHVMSSVISLPIGRHGVNRAALCLAFPPGAHVSAADIELLEGYCRHLSMILSSAGSAVLQRHLLELHASALESETQGLYQSVLDAAIQHVPGAEAGSLLVRRDAGDEFRFVAANGLDGGQLVGLHLTERRMRAWYARGESDWAAGRPRILTERELDLAEFSRRSGGTEEPVRALGLHRLRSTVCLPVAYKGSVLALINLDNFTRADAFGPDSLSTFELFGPPVATLLASAQHRDEIVRASRTDPLTGLANRDGFTRALEAQHTRGRATGSPYSLLMMDLTGFKSINDTLGHPEGDAALVAVARALGSTTRYCDVAARWGGDEFVALLPDCGPREAMLIARRFEHAVETIVVGDRSLGVDVGAASFPHDGASPERVLRAADDRMYEHKRIGRREAAERTGSMEVCDEPNAGSVAAD